MAAGPKEAGRLEQITIRSGQPPIFFLFSCEIDFLSASMMLTTLLGASGSSTLAAFFGFFFSLLAMMSFRRSYTGSRSMAGSQGRVRSSISV